MACSATHRGIKQGGEAGERLPAGHDFIDVAADLVGRNGIVRGLGHALHELFPAIIINV